MRPSTNFAATAQALPRAVSSLVGRDSDLAELRRLISGNSVVTVAGTGGVGKTRLALQAGHLAQRSFPDGVWLAALTGAAPGSDPAPLVAAAFGVAPDELAGHLRGRKALLLLDNCEHVLEACADLVDHLVRMTDLRVLCTSRRPLEAEGEHVWTLAPLPVPPADVRVTAADVTRFPALDLFAQRAVAACPEFRLTDGAAELAADICRHVEGVPLGVELAAAGLRSRSLAQIRTLTATSVPSLATRHRHHSRHTSLRGSCDWDFGLCTPDERLLWARASVFHGDFDLDAATQICGEGMTADAVLTALAGLVDRSVLRRLVRGGATRYQLPRAAAQYGRAALPIDESSLRRRHLHWYLRVAEQAETAWLAGERQLALHVLAAEHENLSAALRDSVTTADVELALRLAGALWFYWARRGFPAETRDWLDAALRHPRTAKEVRTKATLAGGILALVQGRPERALSLLTQSVREPVSEPYGALGIEAFACAVMTLGDHGYAGALLAEALDSHRAAGLPAHRASRTKIRFAQAVAGAGETGQARALYAEIRSEIDSDEELAAACDQLAAHIALDLGELTAAEEHARSALAGHHRTGDLTALSATLELLVGLTGVPRRAATLRGVLEQVWRTLGKQGDQTFMPLEEHTRWLDETRAALGEQGYLDAVAVGAAMDLDEAVAYAVAATGPAPVPRATPETAALTRRERQVCELIAQGLTNREIAARLRIAQRTAEGHVENILRKLAVASRTQVAVLMTRSRS